MNHNKLITKYIYTTSIAILLSFSSYAQKELSLGKIATMLQGHWVSEEDSNFSIYIKHDTIIEYRSGDRKVFEFTLGKESCDPDSDTKLQQKKTTGYYINESSDYDGVEYCNVVVAIADSSMAWFSTDGMMDLAKKK
jgi:hypothetical protein